MATRLFSDIVGVAQVVPVIGVLERVTAYTIGASTTAPTPGTGATFLRVTEQYGPMAKVRFEFSQSAAGSAGSGYYRLPLSSAITVDTTRLAVALTTADWANRCGYGSLQATAQTTDLIPIYEVASNSIILYFDNQGAAAANYLLLGSTTSSMANNPFRFSCDVFLPITNNAFVAQGAGLALVNRPGLVSRKATATKVIALSGATTTPNITVKQSLIDDVVNLTLSPSALVTKNASAGSLLVSPIDAEYRPTANVAIIVYTNNGAVLCTVNTGGSVQVYSSATGSNFAASATNIGWDTDMTLTYSIR